MGLPSRRSLAEARIALGSFDRFLLLYGTMFAAFGVASPFLPALLHERGLGPSEIGAVLAAGTIIAGIPFGLAQILLFLSIMNYLADCYLQFAASALAANSLLRSVLGATFPLWAPLYLKNS